jgi:hypothetical protein
VSDDSTWGVAILPMCAHSHLCVFMPMVVVHVHLCLSMCACPHLQYLYTTGIGCGVVWCCKLNTIPVPVTSPIDPQRQIPSAHAWYCLVAEIVWQGV